MQANSNAFQYVPAQSGRARFSNRASFSSVLMLALSLNASLFSKLFDDGLYSNILQAGAMVMLIVFSLFCARQFSIRAIPPAFRGAILGILVVTLMLGLLGYFGGLTIKPLRMSVLFKSAGTILTLSALVLAAPAFTHREIVRGLMLFAVIEGLVCILLFFGGTDINTNALAVRISVSAMILFCLSDSKAIRISGVVICVGFSLMLQCRTSLCAFLGAMVFMYVERNSRRNRPVVLLSVILGAALAWLLLPFIIDAIKNIAIASLGSDNFIAQFFLSDKSTAKIQNDLLDRNLVWEYSWEFISRRPWYGYGLGTENSIMGARSHNAFLSLLFEGGVFNLLAWVWFYFLSLTRLFNKKLLKRTGDMPLFYLSNLLIGYMLLAGIVETSGLASVATPINLIFILLVVWLFSPRPEIRNSRTALG